MPEGNGASPHISSFRVEGYKAFGAPASIELGRVTLLLGRNNAGKSALCFAPLYLTFPFTRHAESPFPTNHNTIDFGPLQSATFRRRPTGLQGTVQLENSAVRSVAIGAAALPERSYQQFVTTLAVDSRDGKRITETNLEWPQAKALLNTYEDELATVADGVAALRGIRPPPSRFYPFIGHTPAAVDPIGESAPMLLVTSGDKGLAAVNGWFRNLNVRLQIAQRGDAFEILAAAPSGEAVNLLDSGAGVAQVLPLVIATLLAEKHPALLCLEQPELHLHPRAHVAVAELLIDYLARQTQTRLLIETHSDGLVLRLRREVAAGRLSPKDLRIYFVDEDSSDGSHVKEIALNENGTPAWWPKDVFVEPQKEFFAIRREIARRGRKE